jgi:hypothetical protein
MADETKFESSLVRGGKVVSRNRSNKKKKKNTNSIQVHSFHMDSFYQNSFIEKLLFYSLLSFFSLSATCPQDKITVRFTMRQ